MLVEYKVIVTGLCKRCDYVIETFTKSDVFVTYD